MAAKRRAWNDREVDDIIGLILRAGVAISALVVLIGGVIYLSRHEGTVLDYRVFRGEPSDLRCVSGIFQDAMALHGRGIIQLGLLLLIATPVMRVLFTVVAFILQRDRIYAFVTLIVLVVLLFSLAGGGQ